MNSSRAFYQVYNTPSIQISDNNFSLINSVKNHILGTDEMIYNVAAHTRWPITSQLLQIRECVQNQLYHTL